MLKTDITKKQSNQYHNVVLTGTPIVFISDTAWDKIKYLCKHINTVEWSGCIFYKFINKNASILDNNTLDIEIVDIIPLDKGSESFTEYTFDARVLSYMTDMNYFDLKIGHCHSHHNMKTFFSGTDLSELNDNSEFIKPYLSLIVNNAGEFSCRLAARLEKINPTYKCQDIDNNNVEFKIDNNVTTVAYYECKVVPPQDVLNVSDVFIAQYENIVRADNKRQVDFYKRPNYSTQNDLNLNYIDLFDNSYSNNTYKDTLDLSCYLLRLGKKLEKDSIDEALEDIAVCVKNKQMNLDEFVYSLKSNIRTHIDNFFDKKHTTAEQNIMIEEFADSLSFDVDDFQIYEELIEYIINELTTIL